MSDLNWPCDYRSTVPAGVRGRTRVEEFTVNATQAARERLLAVASWTNAGRAVPEGAYRKLVVDGVFMASDTPDELRDMRSFLHAAHGDILIGGLGLGWLVELLLCRPAHPDRWPVTSITVIEISPDVIALVEPHLQALPGGAKVKVIEADVLEWNPKGARYTCAWWDIWSSVCSDNRPEYERLLRRWGQRVKFQDAWRKYDVYERRRGG